MSVVLSGFGRRLVGMKLVSKAMGEAIREDGTASPAWLAFLLSEILQMHLGVEISFDCDSNDEHGDIYIKSDGVTYRVRVTEDRKYLWNV